jgi:hypothetical protein
MELVQYNGLIKATRKDSRGSDLFTKIKGPEVASNAEYTGSM